MSGFAGIQAVTGGSPGAEVPSSEETRGIQAAPPPGPGTPSVSGTRPAPGSSTWRLMIRWPGGGSRRV